MAENSHISWTHHTHNHWEGCQKVGPGCDHCYAEARNARFGGGVAINWGPGAPRRLTSAKNRVRPLLWDLKAKEAGTRYRVFCSSLADVFDNAVDPEWRVELLELIMHTPHLDWLLLTKRIGNVTGMLSEAANVAHSLPATPALGELELWLDAWVEGDPPANVWLGATIVTQEEADRDIPKLLATPAVLRFLSMEPLLGEVDLSLWLFPFKPCADCPCPNPDTSREGLDRCCKDPELMPPMLDWVITGFESGREARPGNPAWVRSLRDQCAGAYVAFHHKQWGEWAELHQVHSARLTTGPRPFFTFPDGTQVERVGVDIAGRHLDGVLHDAVPKGRI